ncbi:MAG: M28 family peptidase [Thermoanaerobaculia bacterium]
MSSAGSPAPIRRWRASTSSTAHLDHIGVGEAVDGDTIRNGFYDNAMGSSILLEVARTVAAAERPRRSVLFVLVTGEERGLLGSDYFATWPTVPASAIVANVNVDMPLLLTPTADLVAFGADHSSLGALAEKAASGNGFRLAPDPMPEEVIFVRSDQYSFVRHGIPAINLSPGLTSVDGSDTQQKAFTSFLANNYHRPSDEIALGADWPSVERFANAEVELVRLIGNEGAKPRWNEGDFFGDLFGAGRDGSAGGAGSR